jgi:hypothetical protein
VVIANLHAVRVIEHISAYLHQPCRTRQKDHGLGRGLWWLANDLEDPSRCTSDVPSRYCAWP